MQVVQIQNREMQVKEYQGQRVVTFDDIDIVHERANGTAGRNFRENRLRFIKGEDYFEISSDEIRRNKIMQVPDALKRPMIFLTESGYLMLVKSFTDDLAWKVQRQLVNCYFRVKEQAKTSLTPSSREEIMLMNAKTRMANMFLKLSDVDTLSKEYKNILVAKASQVLAGEELIPLPRTERKVYSAAEIGEILGISANMVGRLANANNLKTAEYGEWRRSKSEHSAKEVDTFMYYSESIEPLRNLIPVREVK